MPKKRRARLTVCASCPVNRKTLDSIAFSHSCICDLGSLFKVIRDTSEKYSTAYELAGIGHYLANDWSNSLDNEQEQLISLCNPQKDN